MNQPSPAGMPSDSPVRERAGLFNAILCAAVIGAAALTITVARADSHDLDDSATGYDGVNILGVPTGEVTDTDILLDAIDLDDAYFKEATDLIIKEQQDGELSDENVDRARDLLEIGDILRDEDNTGQSDGGVGAVQ